MIALIEEIAAVERAQGASDERLRIVQLIAALPLSECHCEGVFLDVGHHNRDCLWDAEVTFRVRILQSVTTPVTPANDVPDLAGFTGAAAGSNHIGPEAPKSA